MTRVIQTPIGPLTIHVEQGALRAIDFGERVFPDRPPTAVGDEATATQVRTQLEEYFEGQRKSFNLSLAPRGTTFQQRAWRALLEIPHGQSWTYKQQAEFMGQPTAMRAVGAANGKNPIPIVIPCHRVIGSGGKLVGYAGGVEIKAYLLGLEGHPAGDRMRFAHPRGVITR